MLYAVLRILSIKNDILPDHCDSLSFSPLHVLVPPCSRFTQLPLVHRLSVVRESAGRHTFLSSGSQVKRMRYSSLLRVQDWVPWLVSTCVPRVDSRGPRSAFPLTTDNGRFSLSRNESLAPSVRCRGVNLMPVRLAFPTYQPTTCLSKQQLTASYHCSDVVWCCIVIPGTADPNPSIHHSR